MTREQAVRRRRLVAQLLAGPHARSPGAARRLLAIQAQNLRAGRLAVRARTSGLTAADVDAALEDRSVVISWLCRGTLHLVCRDDYPWLLGLASPTQRTGNLRRLHQCGYSPDRARSAAALIERMLAAEGPLRRAAIGERLGAAGYRVQGQALVHLLFLASLDGRVIRGPFRSAEQAFVLTRDWLGGEPAPLRAADRPGALAELAARYLAGHGPASAADLALWAGLPLRDALLGLEGAAGRLRPAGKDLVDVRTRRPAAKELPPRLLPAFDAYLLGWKDRAYAVPPQRLADVRVGGIIRPVVLVDGVAVGTWATRGGGRRTVVDMECWEDVGEAARRALEAEVADVVRFETGVGRS